MPVNEVDLGEQRIPRFIFYRFLTTRNAEKGLVRVEVPEPFEDDERKPRSPHFAGLLDHQIMAMHPIIFWTSAMDGVEDRFDGSHLEIPEEEGAGFLPSLERIELINEAVNVEQDVTGTGFLDALLKRFVIVASLE